MSCNISITASKAMSDSKYPLDSPLHSPKSPDNSKLQWERSPGELIFISTEKKRNLTKQRPIQRI